MLYSVMMLRIIGGGMPPPYNTFLVIEISPPGGSPEGP